MLSTIFLPGFIKAFAITVGVGAGVIISLAGTVLFLIASYPITKRLQK